ncbi:hypothetical protein BDV12DRAFT_203444 [Aspergillus spectabilis]
MEDEGFDRPFRFIVTSHYLSVHYCGGKFELHRDYHARGTLFYLSDCEEKIIHGRKYVGALAGHPSYQGDVFYICQGSQYLAQEGQWIDSLSGAVTVQIDPQCYNGDAETAIPALSSPVVVDADHPISADGIDLANEQDWESYNRFMVKDHGRVSKLRSFADEDHVRNCARYLKRGVDSNSGDGVRLDDLDDSPWRIRILSTNRLPNRSSLRSDAEPSPEGIPSSFVPITFTAPSSYWYMRWFDLPGMLKYADWMNLMTYDLHGTWDSTNAIGSIVQAHTNLTEIKIVTELLWRVNVKPHQVALGFGFYGRSFTLQDPSCTTTLPTTIIDKILSNDLSIKVVHNKKAAVKYFTWNTNQWISFDDQETFQQMLEWADEIGFSGSLIWASDQDTYKLNAYKALTGINDLGEPSSVALAALVRLPVVVELDSELGNSCFKRRGRKKSFCCTPNTEVLNTMTCDADLCDVLGEDRCEDEAGYDDETDGYFSKRSYELADGRTMWEYEYRPSLVARAGARPGSPRDFYLKLNLLLKSLKVLKGDGLSTLSLVGGFSMAKDVCTSTAVKFIRAADLPRTGYNAEHLTEARHHLNMILKVLETSVTGVLPSKAKLQSAVLGPFKLINAWNEPYSMSLPRIGDLVTDVKGWTAPETPKDRIFEHLGSYAYRQGMTLVPKVFNIIKRDLLAGHNPLAMEKFKDLIAGVAVGDMEAAKKIAGVLQQTIGVFNFLNDAVAGEAWRQLRADLYQEWARADHLKPGLKGILNIWKEVEADYYAHAVKKAQAFMLARIQLIENKFTLGNVVGKTAVTKLVYDARELKKALALIKITLD